MNRSPDSPSLRGFGLHQIQRPRSDTSVVFVHGILSGGEAAWGQPSWPELFASDPELKDVGVFVFSYQTTLSSRTYSIGDVVDALREHFDLDGLWEQRRLAFVCHSMGGIVVRRFIVVNQAKLIECKSAIGLFLVASPSLGSSDANVIGLLALVLQHTQALALRFSQTNTWLNDLDREFITLKESDRLPIIGKELVEDRAIVLKRWLGLRKQLVEPFSSGRYFGQAFKVPGSDHISISKPQTSDAIQHRLLKRFVIEFAHPAANTGLVPTNEYETALAYNAVGELRSKLDGILDRRDALAAVQEALLETRHYVEHRRAGGSRDAQVEERLSRTWSEVGYAIQPYDTNLAALCWVKGHGWADERLWKDARFKDLPVQLNEMLQHLVTAMQGHVVTLQSDVAELREGIEAIQKNLDRFEEIRPVMKDLVGWLGNQKPHAVIHRISDHGNAVEFAGYGEVKKATIDDLAKLPSDDRRAIAASNTAMRELMRSWNRVVKRGQLTASDEEELLRIASQMRDRLELIFQVVETGMGGVLQDHYGAQRAIARHASERYAQLQSQTKTATPG
jgi:hypothetical protein